MKKEVYIYTWLRMAEGRVEDGLCADNGLCVVWIEIFSLFVQNECLEELDLKVWRGEGGVMSDHFMVEAQLKVEGGWRNAGGLRV